jgi:hypothetical protein
MKSVELNHPAIWLEIYTRQVLTAKKKFTAVLDYALVGDDWDDNAPPT